MLLQSGEAVKERLANGQLEVAIRSLGFEKLVCVGNFAQNARTLKEAGIPYEAIAALFKLCRGAFADLEWFRSVTTLVQDPEHRCDRIDFSEDWWYVDDLAPHYLTVGKEGQELGLLESRRICTPEPDGDGEDIMKWLKAIGDLS
ncbi:hypothetical protein V2H45_09055 [Tumidithrix elongata RA019]|uniref:Uncharacterized protein n=1 Tax=Tumidithrix elongata BACA0141 TaxID=2716417 RepID=A0AAW9PVU9_9CYAN|nr:hypothetical protein [Tumidithrix elongata RA019]